MKRNNLFERLLVLSCEACEVPVAKAMSKSRSADAVDCRLMAVDLMLKYGLSDVFIASMFSRTRQWVSMCRTLFRERYDTNWSFRYTYDAISCQAISK